MFIYLANIIKKVPGVKKNTVSQTKGVTHTNLMLRHIVAGFPRSVRTKLVYTECITITSAANSGYFGMRANGIYDPNYTGVGHQPLGFDQFAGLYNHYLVTGATCRVSFFPSDTTNSYPLACGLLLHEDGVLSSTTPSTLMEGTAPKDRIVVNSLGPYHGANVPRLTVSYDPKSWFGVKDIEDNAYPLGAPINTNPSDAAVFVAWVADISGSYTPANVRVVFEIDYDCYFTEPIEQLGS